MRRDEQTSTMELYTVDMLSALVVVFRSWTVKREGVVLATASGARPDRPSVDAIASGQMIIPHVSYTVELALEFGVIQQFSIALFFFNSYIVFLHIILGRHKSRLDLFNAHSCPHFQPHFLSITWLQALSDLDLVDKTIP
jgi:hypothetical protein